MGFIYFDSLSSPQLKGEKQSITGMEKVSRHHPIYFPTLLLLVSSTGLEIYRLFFFFLYCIWRFTSHLNLVIFHRYILGSYPLKSKIKQQITYPKHCSVPPGAKQSHRASYCTGRTVWCADSICPWTVCAAPGQQRAEPQLHSTKTLSTFIVLD